jgi:hypothetical protein
MVDTGVIAEMEHSVMRDWRKPTDVFVVWSVIILVGLAFLSVALGIGPVDPAIFASP